MNKRIQKKKAKILKLKKVILESNDIIVLEVKARLTNAQSDSITRQLKKFFPNNQVIVLSDELKLFVVSNKDGKSTEEVICDENSFNA